jgi:eukaryotic-like serine/threonine-protein kinase
MAKICPVCGTEFTDESAFCPADGSTLRSKESEGDLVGQVIADRYLVQKKLGEGGMGAVYLAKHVRLPKQAAIKVLRPEMLADSASVARFNQEAANASQIEHEGVARVFDYGETSDGTVYLAMEFVPGRSLRDVLDQDGALSLEKTATVIRQVAGGLDAAHRLGIVHRDLKPDNILVSADEKTGEIRCKVVDFGIAKAIGGAPGQAALTRTGMVVGTPEFMSPEQLLAGELDHRSDVYALALVAYQCLTLDLPFDLKAPDRGMTARLVSQPRGLAAVRPDLPWPLSLQQVFDQGLDRDPDQRTPSAGAFAAAFDEAVADALGTPVKPGTGVGKAAAKPTTGKTAAKTAAVAGATAAPAEKSGSNGALIGIAAAVLLLGGGGGWWYMGQGASAPANSDSTAVVAPESSPSASSAAPIAGTTPGTAPAPAGAGATQSAASGASNKPSSAINSATNSQSPPPAAASSQQGPIPDAAATGAGAARASLDSISKALADAPDDQSAQVGGSAVAAVRRLLPKLITTQDSVSAYLRLLEANMLREDQASACLALETARRVARTPGQALAIAKWESMGICK